MSFLPDARLPRLDRYTLQGDEPNLVIPTCQKCRLTITSFVWNSSLRRWEPSHSCGSVINLADYVN